MPALSVGRGACVLPDSVRSRPELNGQRVEVVSVGERCRIRFNDEILSLKRRCLRREDKPPWEDCRHGGPSPGPTFMDVMGSFLTSTAHINAPCLAHVRLLEPIVRRNRPPAVLLASFGVDAFAEADFKNCRGFAVSALVLDAAREMGVDALFREVERQVQVGRRPPGAADVSSSAGAPLLGQRVVLGGLAARPELNGRRGVAQSFEGDRYVVALEGAGSQAVRVRPAHLSLGQASPAVRELEESLGKCTSADGLFEVLSRFSTCDCLRIMRARGIGVKQQHAEIRRSEMDAVFDRPAAGPAAAPPPSARSTEARPAGERAGRLALQLLDAPTPLLARIMTLRRTGEQLVANVPARGEAGRAAVREHHFASMQAMAVAGNTFVDAGGMQRVEAICARGLDRLQQSQLAEESAEADEVLLGLEAVASLQSPAVATAALQSSVAGLVCQLVAAAGPGSSVPHNALRALWAILRNAPPCDFAAALGMELLRPVVAVCGRMFVGWLRENALDFACLDVVCCVVTQIAGGGPALADLVATLSARGFNHAVPTSLAIILFQHTHEARRGGRNGRDVLKHLGPINLALEGLYTISLHFDLRAVHTNPHGCSSRLPPPTDRPRLPTDPPSYRCPRRCEFQSTRAT